MFFFRKIIILLLLVFSFFMTAQADEAFSQSPPNASNSSSSNAIEKVFYHFLESITGSNPSLYQKKINKVEQSDNRYTIALYKPSYVIPAYYTEKPDFSAYGNSTPDDQTLDRMEFKGQISFLVPIVKQIAGSKMQLDMSYTQLSYWQVYAKSQYFRETDYTPALFISDNFINNWQYDLGLKHQSNGRGGEYERSWNRLFGDVIFARNNWMVDIEPWILIFKNDSSNLHNPDIRQYMGNGQIQFAYKWGKSTFALMSRNNLQSRFKRGAVEFDWSYPVLPHFSLFLQEFNGYGQSLIEYNHYTNSIGIGFALNNLL